MESSLRPKLRPPEPEFEIPYGDLEKIERVVAAEANTEGVEGRNAVRGVIFNRLASKRFGNTVDEVLIASEFEPVNTYGSIEAIPVDQEQIDRGMNEIVDYIQLGEDASQGSTFFQNEAVTKRRGSQFKGMEPLKIGNHTFYKGIAGQEPVNFSDIRGSHNITVMYDDLEVAQAPEFALGGLMEARKGITTEAGLEMASKKYQRDDKKADIDGDGTLNEYEKARGDAVQQAMTADDPEQDDKIQMYHGGMACGCDEGLMTDPESGNEIPIGSSAENVRDDIDIKISEGEYVLPADVVKWHGLKHIMEMEAEAKMGLMTMYDDGLIQYVDQDYEEEESSGEDTEDTEVQAEDNSEQEENPVIETPEGNQIEMVSGMTTEEEEMEPEDPEEEEEGYYPSENREYTMMKKPMIKFII